MITELNHISNVDVVLENNVLLMTINHAPVNALNAKTIEDIAECIRYAEQTDEVRAVVVTGQGKCFVAGADIKEFVPAFGDAEAGKQLSVRAQDTFFAIERLKKPVIAAINGACLGGGLELAMSCHLRIASSEAKLGQPELNLGLIPGFGGTQRLPRLVNKGKALEMILTGVPVTGAEAEHLGLVNKAVPLEELLPEAKRLANLIAQDRSALTTAAVIQAVNEGLESSLDDGMKLEADLWGKLFETEDVKEGVNAFIEKRAAQFHHQ